LPLGLADGSHREQMLVTAAELLQPDLQVTARAAPVRRAAVILVHMQVLANDVLELALRDRKFAQELTAPSGRPF
jgi:hypothetical protein